MSNRSRGLTERISVTLTAEDKQVLESYCQKEKVSISDGVRSLIRSLKSN